MNASETYTLYTKTDADKHIIARGLSPAEAMAHIVERELDRRFEVTCENYKTFRCFDCSLLLLDRRRLSDGSPTFHATVPLTEDYEADEASALKLIAIQFLRTAYRHWDGWVMTDEDFDEDLRDQIRHEAALEETERLEREIADKFVDALKRGGYHTVTDTIGNNFVLGSASDRKVLLKYFFNHRGIAEYTVDKAGVRDHFHVGFGKTALEFVQSESETIEDVLAQIVAPYRQDPRTTSAPGENTENPPADREEAPAARP